MLIGNFSILGFGYLTSIPLTDISLRYKVEFAANLSSAYKQFLKITLKLFAVFCSAANLDSFFWQEVIAPKMSFLLFYFRARNGKCDTI